jgi:hypothetical protein
MRCDEQPVNRIRVERIVPVRDLTHNARSGLIAKGEKFLKYL